MNYRRLYNRKKKKNAKSPDLNALEQRVVDETVKAAEAAGYLHRKVVYSNRNGAPDDWFFGFDQDLIIIEFKAPGKKPEPHQEEEIKRLRLRGFKVYVIDNEVDGKHLFANKSQW